MRHIARNNTIAISANSVNVNYPAVRAIDEHPKRPYKAVTGQNVATITAEVLGGCSDIMIAGTNAASASILVSDPNAVEWGYGSEWGYGTEWANTEISVTASVIQRSKTESLWLALSETVGVPCEVAITLTAPGGETLKVGVVTANIAKTYGGRNPRYGLGGTRVDTSIRDENSNGSRYYKKRDILRVFRISMLLATSAAFELENSFDDLGEMPSAWKITDKTGNEWVIYGRFEGPPETSHDHLGYSNANFTIVEVL